MLREIVLDTETTGLDAKAGDRLIEIGCLELINRIPSGREFHSYVNPGDRPVHPDAQAVHGISTEFLRDKPAFESIVDELLTFVGDAALVIHNATFDIGFINSELERIGREPISMDRVVDTLALARRKHPGGANNLDALCKRYGIDNSKRTKHGALMDAALLAEVYVELLGERQAALELIGQRQVESLGDRRLRTPALQRPNPLPPRLSAAAEALHREYVSKLGENAIWRRWLDTSEEKAA
jgi:DNA polymerase-3 subunit epsilon